MNSTKAENNLFWLNEGYREGFWTGFGCGIFAAGFCLLIGVTLKEMCK